MKSVGVVADKDEVKTMVDKLKGKDLKERIASGQLKFAAMGGGGGGAAAASAPAAGGAGDAPAKEEEKPKEEEEEEDVDMGGLFGDDGY